MMLVLLGAVLGPPEGAESPCLLPPPRPRAVPGPPRPWAALWKTIRPDLRCDLESVSSPLRNHRAGLVRGRGVS